MKRDEENQPEFSGIRFVCTNFSVSISAKHYSQPSISPIARPNTFAMDYLGRLIPRFKIRSKKRVIEEIVQKMEAGTQDGHDYSGKCYISQSDCYEDAATVAKLVEERFPKLNGKVEINYVGTTIGSHTGPGTVALFFWGNTRND